MTRPICIIPARGGSKRIPRKNIRKFRGKPLIAWSVAAAIDSQIFDQIIVSTDDAEIATTAQDYGAYVPFIRPSSLSDDFSGTSEVIAHAISQLELSDIKMTPVCCLYATAPFATADDLRDGYAMWSRDKGNYPVFTATTYSFPIQRGFLLDENNRSQMLSPDMYDVRSQDLPEVFHDAGQSYWASAYQWLNNPRFGMNSIPLILPRWRVQDIDTEEDWVQAELMHQLIEARG